MLVATRSLSRDAPTGLAFGVVLFLLAACPVLGEPVSFHVLRSDALDPPLHASELPRSAADVHELTAVALPGTSVRWGLTVVGRGQSRRIRVAEPVLTGEGISLRATCLWALSWPQRDAINPERSRVDPRQVVRELLVRDATVPLPTDGRRPTGLLGGEQPVALVGSGEAMPLLVKVAIPRDLPPGRATGALVVLDEAGARARIDLDIDVLPAVPLVPADPVVMFYRGRLAGSGENGDWPEVVTEAELRRDLALIADLGATDVTCYGGPRDAARFTAIARGVGLAPQLIDVGWFPGPGTTLSPERVRAAVAVVDREVRETLAAGLPRPLFWVGDEPVGPEVGVVGRRALIVAGGGGLSTASLQAEPARQLAGLVDVPMIDNYSSTRLDFLAAVNACREAGAEPWQYWQCWLDGARVARWNAGFRQLSEPTRGQALYALAHATESPWDDFDGSYKDMMLVYPQSDGMLVTTLQFEGAQAGLEDLRVAAAAAELVRGRRESGSVHGELDGALAAARWTWRREANESWSRYVPTDVAAPGRGRGPAAGALEATRARLLGALRRALRHESVDVTGRGGPRSR